MSQNLRIALWIPSDRINVGESVISQVSAGPGQSVSTAMGNAVGGAGGGASNVKISTTPPVTPTVGDVWVDISNPLTPQVKVFKQGNAWVVMATGQSLPKATKPDELLASGAGPSFNWKVEDTINLGNY